MPGQTHASLVDLFVGHLPLVVELVQSVGFALPDLDELEQATESLAPSQLGPFLPDLVFRLVKRRDDGTRVGVLVVVVEVQLRPDAGKVGSFALYGPLAAGLFRSPAVLVVVTPSAAVARWARDLPMVGSVMPRPLVLGPEELLHHRVNGPLTLERAVLVALAHAPRPGEDAERALEVEVSHLVDLDDAQRVLHFLDVLSEQFGRRVHHLWEAMMPTSTREYRSEWLRGLVNEGLEQGLEQGRVRGLGQGRS
jgi:hypothetical protein